MTSKPQIPKPIILQRDKKTYAIRPRTPMGMLSADVLENIAAVIRKFHIPFVKITAGQRFMLSGVKEEDIEAIREQLGPLGQVCGYYVQACPGDTVCRLALKDSLSLGSQIDELLLGMSLPAKVKVGISGCPMCCGESYIRDIGIMARKDGWTVIVGGSSSRKPRVGDLLAESLAGVEALGLVKRFLGYYVEHGKKRQRVPRFVEQAGIESLKRELL